ncbi:hypothetical protein Tco_0579813, partial [Tanacetum coccineum]
YPREAGGIAAGENTTSNRGTPIGEDVAGGP